MSTKFGSSTAIETWLTVTNGRQAVDFYISAFQARETYRMEDPGGGLVVRLAVDDAGFWVSCSSGGDGADLKPSDGTMRLILIVQDPDAFFSQAIAAGATEVFPVGEEYGWRLGRLVDPFGFHWEIGHPIG